MIVGDFIQSSTMVRGLERKLLKREQLQSIANAKDYDAALFSLRDMDYGKHMDVMKSHQDYESMLTATLSETYKEVESFTPSREFIQILSAKYSVHNLKVFVKSQIKKEDLSALYSPIGILNMEEFEKEFERGMFSLKNDFFGKSAMEILADYEKNKDPHRVGLLFDQFYFRYLKELAKKVEGTKMADYVYNSIDFTNVKTVFRIKKQGLEMGGKDSALFEGGHISLHDFKGIYHMPIPELVKSLQQHPVGEYLKKGLKKYEETGHLNTFDKAMEDYQANLMESARRQTYGAEVIFNFLLTKELEVRNLRILLAGRLTGMPAEEVMKRLRDTYV